MLGEFTLQQLEDGCRNGMLDSWGQTIFRPDFKETFEDMKEELEYVLLPVWMVNVKYNGKMYPFAMNGQTGKMIGDIPYSKGKAFACFIIIFVIVFILAMIGTWIVS